MNQSSPPPQRSFVVPETPPLHVSSPLLQTPINSSPPVIVDGTLPTTVIRPPVQGVVQGAMSPRVLSFRDVNSNDNGNDNGNGSNVSNGSGNGGGSGRRKSTLLLKRIKSKSKKSKQSKQSKRSRKSTESRDRLLYRKTVDRHQAKRRRIQ